MLIPDLFTRFVSTVGRNLSEINPGSDEVALETSDAIKALDLLAGSQVAILGGDVLSDSSGKLSYVYENWYCERLLGESPLDFVQRSQAVAREFIENLARRGNSNLFIVLVCSELGIT